MVSDRGIVALGGAADAAARDVDTMWMGALLDAFGGIEAALDVHPEKRRHRPRLIRLSGFRSQMSDSPCLNAGAGRPAQERRT